MQSDNEKTARKIKPHHAIYPILIGVGVVGYMFYKNFDPAIFSQISFNGKAVFWLFVAIFFMFGRDFFYIVRLRILAEGKISWYEAFRAIMLWEFTSAITPSAVGGTSVAIIYVHKAGLSIGESSSVVLLTSFFDELYFIIMFPLLMAVVGIDNLFTIANSSTIANSLISFAMIGYGLKTLYVVVLSYGFFINPHSLKWLITKVFKLRFLRRWGDAAAQTGDEIIQSAKSLKEKSVGFYLKAFGATFLSWSSRYLVANAIVIAFFAVGDNLLLFARQLVMWIMMLVMPTPGGSGFAEYIFTTYCTDLIQVPIALQLSAATLIAFLWRNITYYPYLAIGAIIFPRWLMEKFNSNKANFSHKTGSNKL